MKLFKAYIGRSSYEIPYEQDEDLQDLQEICKEVNSLINIISSQDKTANQEFALVLALVNLVYENKTLKPSQTSQKKSTSQNIQEQKTYTQSDVLQIIEYMRSKVQC